MSWWIFAAFISFGTVCNAINRPVYKIILTQKGYAQFLQYDLETPPLREFTFCTWIRVNSFEGDQSIFTYVANGNNRVIRLWLDSGGQAMKISINERVTSSAPVEIAKDTWRHVCLSYQSDYGAWALYIDARLVSCEASQSVYGYVVPGDGSIIIGYGTSGNGTSNGFEGEIYGANMILISTIERNYTMKKDPLYGQKTFPTYKIKNNNNNHNKYVIFSELQTDEGRHDFKSTDLRLFSNKSKNYIKFTTPHSIIQHDVGIELATRKSKPMDLSSEKEIYDFSVTKGVRTTTNKANLWNIVNEAEHTGKYKIKPKINTKQPGAETQDLIMISEYETPPPITMKNIDHPVKGLDMDILPVSESFYRLNDNSNDDRSLFSKHSKNEPSSIEIPPPIDRNPKVYGQWTSSKYAGSVLNYLKSINFYNRETKKVPPTLPLTKTSDAFPYSSNFKVNKVRPQLKFQRKIFRDKHIGIKKRDTQGQQINVQIVENDLRSSILKTHALTQPQHVEVTNRGMAKEHTDKRFYRNIDSTQSHEDTSRESVFKKPIVTPPNLKKHKTSYNFELQKDNNLVSILPFLKSIEYFLEDTDSKTEKIKDMYTKSLSSANKWHNVKSYSNDYTPRQFTINSDGSKQSGIDDKIVEANKKYPTIRLKYKPNARTPVLKEQDDIIKARELATEVSKQSKTGKESISILKYNHGFLPGQKKVKTSDKINAALKSDSHYMISHGKNNFNKQVKIGNALNEKHVIGSSKEQNRKSFVGGDEKVPDINKYRSDVENKNDNIPSSLSPRICKNLELYDRVLYVQPDGSIDMTHILSPVRVKNIGIEFVLQNYKKCSLEDSVLRKSLFIFIDWTKTPVRLFGGAYPKKTTDLCGFF